MGKEWDVLIFYKQRHLSSAMHGRGSHGVLVPSGLFGEIISFHSQPEGDLLFLLTEARIEVLVDKVTSQITQPTGVHTEI